MSRIKPEAIWQHDKVLPYILMSLRDKINEITTVEKILLFGSRGRHPVENWNELEGKDWDILVQAKSKLKNAHVLVDKDYHLDLLILNEDQVSTFCKNKTVKEIFPVNELKFLINKIENDGKI